MNSRVAVLGGSFDPVHRAHLLVAQRALDQLELDEIWLLPARWAAHKSDRPPTPARHRLAMLELAVAGLDGLSICSLELDSPEGQRSVDTMRELRRREPNRQFYFLMGEDSFRGLGQWREPEELARLAPLIVQPRPPVGSERPVQYAGSEVRWLEGDPVELSSSSLRKRLAEGAGADALPPGVYDYIQEHGLYDLNARGGSA